MNRPGHSAVSQCCCSNPEQGGQNYSSRYRQQAGEDFGYNQNATNYPEINTRRRNPSYVNSQANDSSSTIDDQTLNTLTSFRQKACQFLRSDSDSSGSPPGAPNRQLRFQSPNPYGGSNVLRRANDLIDYAPQSEFLKKMKQQCQYLQNNQPNIFSTLDNCEEFVPHECQKCIEKTKRILTLGEQIRCNRVRSPPEGMLQSCSCNHQSRVNVMDDNQIRPRDPQYMYSDNQRVQRDPRMLPKGNLDRITEEANDKILQKSSRCAGEFIANEKKSEHLSRSKKPVKCRGRRKRKSDSSEKCESEEEIEPNLKKPHENSCERCWRFASPSRSPVNKPDQRFDPNFRRGHSCMDFNQERGDGDLEIAGTHISPCKNLQPVTSKDKAPSQSQPSRQHPEVMPQKTQFGSQKTQFNPQAQFTQQKTQFSVQKPECCQQQQQEQQFKRNSSLTKVKELLYNYSRSKSPEKVSPKTQPCENGRKSPRTSPGILQSETARKARPKSFTTGVHALKSEDLPSYLLDVTDYYDLCVKPKQGLPENDANKRAVTGSGNRTVRPFGENGRVSPIPADGPLKVCTPSMANRPGPSPRASSTPKQGSKSKTVRTPEHCAAGPSPKAEAPQTSGVKKTGSPKARSPKTPTNLNISFGTPGTDSTVYAEVSVKKNPDPCSPKKSPAGQTEKTSKKSPSPKTKSKNGKSPRKGSKSSPKGSPKRVHSSSDCLENPPPSHQGRPQTVFEPVTDYEGVPNYGMMQEGYPGGHPVSECWCPPRAPFLRNPNSNPDHVFCCHCNWEAQLRNQAQCNQVPAGSRTNAAQNYRQNPQFNEMNDGQFVNDPCYRRGSPSRVSSPKRSSLPFEDMGVECPYRAYQLERKAANDTSWEADYEELREYCMKNPESRYQDPTRREPQTNTSKYVPTKYAVFYMTQNKLDKGDDVEVLVEELTQACPNQSDSRTKDITEKMKRIMECPSDSMALRFQKGVSETCKTPHSSRILYF